MMKAVIIKYKQLLIIGGIFFSIFAYVKFKDYRNRVSELDNKLDIHRIIMQNDSLEYVNEALKIKMVYDSICISESRDKIISLENSLENLNKKINDTKKKLSVNDKSIDTTNFSDDLLFISGAMSEY